MSDGIEIEDRRDGLLAVLENLELDADRITVIVKSGGSCDDGGSWGNSVQDAKLEHSRRRREFCCCKHQGILCNVTRSYIVLIGNRKKIFIPINAIAAIIKEDCC